MEGPALIHLLGIVRYRDGRAETVLSGAQPRTVLAYTALHHGRPVAVDELADVLWPHGPGRHWDGALRGVISKVRSFLAGMGPAAARLDNVGHSYCFHCPDGTRLDVWQATGDLARAEALLAAGDPRAAGPPALRAVALLDAPLLSGLEGAWLDRHRSELAGMLVRALRASSATESATEHHDEAVRLATTAVGHDPYDEASHRALMDAHLAGGNRAGALRAYGVCRRTLAEELGVSPSEPTEQTYLRILATRGGAATPAGSRHAPSGPAADATPADRSFVGRDRELVLLDRAWAAARAGRRQVVFIHGESGAGKTRLALESVRRSGPTNVLYGRSSPEQVIPFEPFTEAIGRHLSELDDEQLHAVVGTDGAELAGVVPAVATRCRVDPMALADGDHRPRALEAVRSVLGRIVSESTILVLDDLHWADPSTLLLLRHLFRLLDHARLLVVATYRDDEEPHPVLAEAVTHLHRMEGSHSVRVGGLDAPQVAELLRGAGLPDPDRLGVVLHERTGGNPFYVGEVLAAATERPDAFDPLKVPDTVSELVRHRVVMLPGDERDVLALAATIGTTVHREVLERAMAIDGCRPDAVDGLVARGLLLEGDGSGDGYTFAHAIVRDAVFGQLPRTRRRRLHLTVARAVAIVGDGSADWAATLSHHYLAADDPAHAAQVVDATVRAADHALNVLAYEQAADLYAGALRYLHRCSLVDPRAAGIHVGLGAAQRRAGRPVEARHTLETAVALARDPAQGAVFAEAVLELVAKGGRGVAIDLADPDRAELLQEAADRLEDDDVALRVSVLSELALALLLTDQVERRHQVATTAHRTAMRSGRPDVVARAAVAHRLLLTRPDGAAARLAHTDPFVGPDRHHVQPEQLARIHMWRLTDCFELGDRTGVDRELAALCDQAQVLAQPYWLWLAETWRALHAFVAGDDERADALAVAALDHVDGLDHPETMLAYGIQLVGFRLQQGRGAEIVDLLAGAAADNPAVPGMQCALAFALAQAGEHLRARDHLLALSAADFAAIPDDSNWAISMVSLAETSCLLGEGRVAAAALSHLDPYRDRFVVVSGFGAGGGCWGPYSATLGALRACVGDPDGARRDLEQALAAVTAFDSPPLRDRVAAQVDGLMGRVPPLGQ